jgi:calcium-translocating P-type ATPase
MKQPRDMESPLYDKDGSQRAYYVKREELCDLFSPDNIRDGASNQKLISWGGTDGMLNKLKVTAKGGLNPEDQSDVVARQFEFGSNDAIEKPQKTILDMITEQFQDPMLKILSLAAFVSLLIGVADKGLAEGWIEGLAIFIAVIIIVSVTAFNTYLRDKQFRNLYGKMEKRDVMVIRNGKVQPVCIYNLLVGDIMQVTTGESFPVDGILIRGHSVLIDESSVTGESPLVTKIPIKDEKTQKGDKMSTPFLISGSKVMEGTGEMMVAAVGVHSFLGKIKLRFTEDVELTPLQLKLEKLVNQIGTMGTWCAGITVLGMMGHTVFDSIFLGEGPGIFTMYTLTHLVDAITLGITMIVVAIPEGLPLAVTIALAYSVGKMKQENNLVRHMSACETMGGANNICTDKTGTLTQNIMSVASLYYEEQAYSPIQNFYQSKATNEDNMKILCEGICLNSTACPTLIGQDKFEQLGNKTECALLELAYKKGFDYEKHRKQELIKKVVPFSSKLKMMATICQVDKKDQFTVRIFVKGASEVILEKCTKLLQPSGPAKTINEAVASDITKKIITSWAGKSLRTIAVAYKDHKVTNLSDIENIDERIYSEKLTLVAIAGIKDPLRPEIPLAIKNCRKAGITVRMVTGDNVNTAISIAKECGILTPDPIIGNDSFIVMEGKRFREICGEMATETDKDGKNITRLKDIKPFETIAKDLRVLARSTPEDKYMLVTGLKQLGHVVAVTGDGTNDAPALKKADIGFAMGIAGTEVAKEAAGIIIMDDNFNSIVTAVKWGRNIFDCIKKFLQFQLTVNVVAMFMVFLGGVLLSESPFTPIQMLWVNLIMDTFASLALATEPPNDSLLERKPHSKYENLVTPLMWKFIMGQAVFQIIVLTTMLFWGEIIFGVPSSRNAEWSPESDVHYTLIFNTFVFMQVFNEINARKLKKEEVNVFEGFFNNPMFLLILMITVGVQILFVELGGKALHTAPLSVGQHLTTLVIGSVSLIVAVIIKNLPDSFMNNMSLLDETPIEQDEIDKSMASMYRKQSSTRFKKVGQN